MSKLRREVLLLCATLCALGAGPRESRAAKVDFLWVIDNSPSMAGEQAVLSAAADDIGNQLATARCAIDWRMAVAYPDPHLRPGAQRALVNGLLCPLRPTVDNPVPCSDRLPDPALFDRYSQVIAAMGGTEGSIRNTDMMDLNDAITQIVDAAIAGACCGNGVIDPGEDCDDGNQVNGDCCSSNCKFEPATTLCRPAAGPCDVADFCTGTSAACPSDAKKKSVCRAAAGPCDVAEHCDGTHDTCPADAFKSADTECRAAAGVCDTAESCTGTDA